MTQARGGGATLADRLAAPPRMTPVEVAGVGHQLGEQLGGWHRHGRCHRALDPRAVQLERVDDARWRAWLRPPADDAVAAPRYRAPELGLGRSPSPAADVFGLGVVLLDALIGARDEAPSVPAELGAAWRYLLTGMIAASPADRPTADTVARTLAQVPGVTPAAAPAPAPSPVPPGPRSKLLPPGTRVEVTPVELPRGNRLSRLLPPVPGRRRPRDPDVRHQPGQD